ncbi:hypothetical protein DdX_03734 [Ditylenchus destructor]|uniref:Uncharacterized protein n=1 Tax=Ditylenchus destructor TaxID=166010 RepID=A0AAD4NFJ1_9BILA|nr:hypothetical protein DdX_03734 [Ditylenchus destructor]
MLVASSQVGYQAPNGAHQHRRMGPQSERGKTVPATACCQLDSQDCLNKHGLRLLFWLVCQRLWARLRP